MADYAGDTPSLIAEVDTLRRRVADLERDLERRDHVEERCGKVQSPWTVLFWKASIAISCSRDGITVLDEWLDFLQKPFTRSELAAKVRSVLDRR